MKIKYSPFSILFVTATLTSLVIEFISIILNLHSVGLGETFTVLVGLVFILVWLNWLDLFFFPFLTGKPALILNTDGLFVTSIGQLIPWTDIQETQIKYTARTNYKVKIFMKNPNKTVIQTKSITRQFWCLFSNAFFDTPFTFSTIFIQGRAVDIYEDIKSKIK